MKSRIILFTLVVSILSPAFADHVIFISCDGTRPDAITNLGPKGAPTFHRIRREGAYTDNARTDATYTVTLPNHTAMVTGRGVVGQEGHQWISNKDPKLGQNLHRNRKGYISSVFAEVHDHGLRTALFASKSKFALYDISYNEKTGAVDEVGEDNGKDKLDIFQFEGETEKLVDGVVAALKSDQPPHFTMLHLRDPDSAGHAHSWDVTSSDTDYMKAVSNVDALIGRLFKAVETNDSLKGKTWFVIVADHGGLTKTKGHGEAKEEDNYTIPFYVWGPGVKAGAELYAFNSDTRQDPGKVNPAYGKGVAPIRSGGAGNLVLKLLGLPAIEGSTINAEQDLKVLAGD